MSAKTRLRQRSPRSPRAPADRRKGRAHGLPHGASNSLRSADFAVSDAGRDHDAGIARPPVLQRRGQQSAKPVGRLLDEGHARAGKEPLRLDRIQQQAPILAQIGARHPRQGASRPRPRVRSGRRSPPAASAPRASHRRRRSAGRSAPDRACAHRSRRPRPRRSSSRCTGSRRRAISRVTIWSARMRISRWRASSSAASAGDGRPGGGIAGEVLHAPASTTAPVAASVKLSVDRAVRL